MGKEFEKSKLILGNDGEISYLEGLSELVQQLFGDEYIKMSPNEQLKQRHQVAYPRAVLNDRKVAYWGKGIVDANGKITRGEIDIDKSILINNDMTLVLGLADINAIQVLERMDANIFGKYVDKSELSKQGNYLNVNRLSQNILKGYLQEREKDEETR